MNDRPSRDTALMATAGVWSQRSTCSRAHVGAVIAVEGRIIVTGYNGAPAGMPHCNHDCTCTGYRNPAKNRPHAGVCPQVIPCVIAVHAEANAVAFAAREGLSTKGSELFVTMDPCYGCAKLIVNAGIVRVVSNHIYRDHAGYDLLVAAGIEVERMS